MGRPRYLVVALALLAACHDDKPAGTPAPAPSATASAAASDASYEDPALKPGTKVPSFRLNRLDGAGAVGIPNGKVTIIAFIATWNGPAKEMLPRLQEIYVQYAPKGLAIIGISVDDDDRGVSEFAEHSGAKFSITWDKGHVVATQLRPSHMPTTYILDRNGVLRFVHGGYHVGAAEEMTREAASLL